MRSLAQRDGEGHAAQLAADIEDMEIAARSIRNGYRIIMHRRRAVRRVLQQMMARIFPGGDIDARRRRSAERRGGKECVGTCRSRWSQVHDKKKKTTDTFEVH